jgi:hypothetical protein
MDLELGLKLCKLIGTKVSSMETLEKLLHLVRIQIGEVNEVPADKIAQSQEWLNSRQLTKDK